MAESIVAKMVLDASGFVAGADAAEKRIKGVTGAAKPAAAGLKNTGRGAREAGAGLNTAKTAARHASSGLSGVEKSASGAGNALGGLGRKLAGLVSIAAAAAGVKSILNLSDEMASIKARTDLMNDGLQTTGELQDAIFQSAQRARGEYQGTADAVAKMGILAKDAFSSNDETVAFMEQVNKQFAISGTSAEGRSAAMLQLTQAMGSGTLRGEELNSVLEQAPTIVQTIAKSLGVSTGELRNMAAEGKITSSVVKKSLLAAADETNEKFESMPMTFSQTLASAKNIAVYGSQDIMQSINDVINGKDGGDIEQSVQKMTDNFEDLFRGVERGVKRSGPAVKRMLKAAAGEVPRFTASIVKSMSAGLKDFTNGGIDIALAIGEGIKSELPTLIPAVSSGIMDAVGAVIGRAPDMLAAGSELINSLAMGIVNHYAVMKEKAGELIDGFFEKLNDPAELDKMLKSGISVVESIVDGIEDMGYSIVDAGIYLGGKLIEGIMTTNWIDVAKRVVKAIAENITLDDVLGLVIPGYAIGKGAGRSVLEKTGAVQQEKNREQAKKAEPYVAKNNGFGGPLAASVQNQTFGTIPVPEKAQFGPGLASGGRVTASGSVMVGEKGPEILNLPRGASVMPLEKVSRTTSKNTIYINIDAKDRTAGDVMSEFIPKLRLALNNM
mgnify:CR=1 FL=1